MLLSLPSKWTISCYFERGRFLVNMSRSDDMEQLFMPSLLVIRDLMEDQVAEALMKGTMANKIVLVGGFGDSPALKRFLRGSLDKISSRSGVNDGPIELLTTPPYVASFYSSLILANTGVATRVQLESLPARLFGPETNASGLKDFHILAMVFSGIWNGIRPRTLM
jgi:hypothetical protein